ncbi:MAG TPA: MCE family protein [Frankiaceae bacterium]|nr:MCE family protein [Frankiaceae bacterium]
MRLTTTAQKAIAFLATMIVVVGGLVAMFRGGEADVMTVTARFPQTVGLYPGSSVRVLGVPVGTVRTITPDGPNVAVVMEIPNDTPIPADATAVIIPPSLVSDRYVEFTPVYGGGARLADGAVLDERQTMTPVELDEILGGLDAFLVALGPNGANADGSLGRLVDIGARTLGKGGGQDFHDTITNLAQAIRTLSDNRGDLTGVIQNLAAFTDTLARNDSQIRALTGTLADATQYLASERVALAEALKNLAVALGEIADLVRGNSAQLGADIRALADITTVVVKHRASLIEALEVLPLGATNIASTVNTEQGTLDIRNNNHQEDDPYGVIVCWIVAPMLDLDCPPHPGGAAGAAAGAGRGGTAAPKAVAPSPADALVARTSPLALLGGDR